jgi:predicted flavoprotein YhiN
MPHLAAKDLDNSIVTILHKNGAKQLKNVIKLFAPEGIAPYLVASLEKSIDMNQKAADVNRDVRLLLLKAIKESRLTVEKLMGLEKAVVADGGVSLKEIDTRTFRSKLYRNLFVTGDLLDITRPSGGFSLQLCWTSGFIAGTAANPR